MSSSANLSVPRGTSPLEQVGACPICGSTDAAPERTVTDHTLSREPFTVQCCGACGFRYTSPRPAQTDIGAYYLSDDYISHAAQARSLKDKIYRWARSRAIRRKHLLIARYQPAGNVLDLGCGTGEFLAHLSQQGYAVHGVEVSERARLAARSKGLPVEADLARLPEELGFDVITLWHVLEHLADPRATLATLFNKCRPGGLLVIAVPDNASWDAAHYGSHWAAWDVPRHLSHFRRPHIHRLLQETGFELIATRPMWLDAPYVAMLSEQYRGAGPMGVLVKGGLVGAWSNAVAALTGRPTSSSLFLARKPATPGRP